MQQVLAKTPRYDARLQILVGRSDHAHVYAHRGLAADPVELPFGQHPQQPRLQGGRHVADLIEEQRAPVSLLEAAPAQRISAGERTLLVPEKLRLQQVGRERRSVECDDRLAGARAVPVQRACDKLLARAGFSRDQHGHARARQATDRAEHLLHGARLAQQFRDAAAVCLGIHWHRRLLGGTAHELDRLVDIKGLGEIFERAALIRGDRRIKVGVGRDDDHRQGRMQRLDFAEELEAAAPRHTDVSHQHIGRLEAQRSERFVGLVEGAGDHAAAAQRLFQYPAYRGVVVHQPDL